MIQSYQSKAKSMCWFEKAEQLQKDINWTSTVLSNVEYMSGAVHKLSREFIPKIKNSHSVEGEKLVKKIEAFLSIYQLTPVDFELFHPKAFSVFEWYVEGFETQGKEIEEEMVTLEEGDGGIKFVNQEEVREEEEPEEWEEESESGIVSVGWNVR